jgi:sugar phosphate isomerase/epimerase
MINLEKKKARVIDSLRQVIGELPHNEIKLGIENHWGVSSRPETIMEIIGKINSPHLGTCPDFGNFPKDVDPYRGLEMLAPKAIIVHAKCYGFDSSREDKKIDFERCLNIFHKTDYNGPVTVEYGGEGNDLMNCQIARELILNTFRDPGRCRRYVVAHSPPNK